MPLILNITDRSSFAVSRREYTEEGFLKVGGKVARTGVQDYLQSELDLPVKHDNNIRVMRLADDVFNTDSLSSFSGADITVEHPGKFVDADTYKSVSVGTVMGIGKQVGDFVECELYIKDKAAIKAIEAGKVQLSVGYSAEYKAADSNADYDYTQTNIKVNHVALVDNARAGMNARIFDAKGAVTMSKITLNAGRTVEIEDAAIAALVTDSLESKEKTAKDAEKSLDKMTAERDSLKEQLAKLKAKSTDSAIAKQVKLVADTQAKALKVAGKEFTCDSVNPVEIQRAALAKTGDSIAWAEKSDAYIEVAFDMKFEKKADEDEEEDKKKAKDSYQKFAADGAKAPAVKVSASQKMTDARCNSWKKTAGEQ